MQQAGLGICFDLKMVLTATMSGVVYIFVIFLITGSQADCPEFGEIPEESYDRNYSSIQKSEARPLGFQKATYIYEQEHPCFTVKGESGQAIEVLFETVPESTLCVRRDGDADGTCDQTGKIEDCRISSLETTKITFYCGVNEGCSESDVSFWVQITKGPLPADDTEESWCHNRDTEYPGSLLSPNMNQIPTTPGPTGAAIQLSTNSLLAFWVFIMITCTCLKLDL